MMWEIVIQTKNPQVVESLMHQNIGAIMHRDMEYFLVKPIDEAK